MDTILRIGFALTQLTTTTSYSFSFSSSFSYYYYYYYYPTTTTTTKNYLQHLLGFTPLPLVQIKILIPFELVIIVRQHLIQLVVVLYLPFAIHYRVAA